MRRFPNVNIEQTRVKFGRLVAGGWMVGQSDTLLYLRAGWAGLGWAGWLTGRGIHIH